MSTRLVLLSFLVACGGSEIDETDPVDTDVDPGCAGLSEQTCGQVDGCVQIFGTRVNGAEQYAGCAAEQPDGCAEEPTAAEDPSDGACWDFDDACVPDGWTVLGASCADP
jgi:hypothetical protein